MAAHDYPPQEAFALLMRKLMERDKDLAAQVQAVVDEDKDVEETELAGSRRKRTRVYQKTMPYSYDEALQAALNGRVTIERHSPQFLAVTRSTTLTTVEAQRNFR
ncbi:MAG: hypothetical protein WCE63_21335 [Acidobacteriaceae bacterium]